MNPSGPVNTVREDPVQKGLLFSGTEREVYFSTDDGASWQSLRKNMPASSIRDLVIHGNDLVIGTHGRSIWILDDFSPLRDLVSLTGKREHLFPPSDAYRIRFNMFSDTPLPPEEPTGQNPPDGAVIDYYLDAKAGVVELKILDQEGRTVNSFSSEDQAEVLDSTQMQHPTYWIRPFQAISKETGHHRFVWNLRYKAPRGAKRGYAIAAVQYNTESGPVGPFVAPGTYKIQLTVDGAVTESNLTVKLDPRSQLDQEALELQTTLSMQCYRNYERLQEMREAVDQLLTAKGSDQEVLLKFRGEGAPEDGDLLYGNSYASDLETETIVGLQSKLLFLLKVVQNSDTRPTTKTQEAANLLDQRVGEMVARWNAMKK